MFASNAEQRRFEKLKAEQFHKHLDTCEQCKNQPFNLCIQGKLLLAETVKESK